MRHVISQCGSHSSAPRYADEDVTIARMQKHVNFEPKTFVPLQAEQSQMRHCLASVRSKTQRASAMTVIEQANRRPRTAISHVRQPKRSLPQHSPPSRDATPVHFLSPPQSRHQYANQVITTYPSLVEALKMRTTGLDEMTSYRTRQPEPEQCQCQRCSNGNTSHNDQVRQLSERGTMTTESNEHSQAMRTTRSRPINVQRAEVSAHRTPSITSSQTVQSLAGSILKRSSNAAGLNYIKYEEQLPERDLQEADSFPQEDLAMYYQESSGFINGYLEPDERYPVQKIPEYPCVPYEAVSSGPIHIGQDKECRCCHVQPEPPIPYSHRSSSSRYHRSCARPVTEDFGFYKTSIVGKEQQTKPWYPVTKKEKDSVYSKHKNPDGVRRPRRVLSSERNIEMYIDKDSEHIFRRSRYY